MKQEATFFEGREPELVYIAKRLRDALQIEQAFERAGLDFGVEADTYQGGIVFRSERVGAFFYVLPQAAEEARNILMENGFRPMAPEEKPKQEVKE
jgi:hypothetical protein